MLPTNAFMDLQSFQICGFGGTRASTVLCPLRHSWQQYFATASYGSRSPAIRRRPTSIRVPVVAPVPCSILVLKSLSACETGRDLRVPNANVNGWVARADFGKINGFERKGPKS